MNVAILIVWTIAPIVGWGLFFWDMTGRKWPLLREIYVHGQLYMLRAYLFGAPKMPDGSWPFEPSGKIRAKAIRANLSMMVHQIRLSDPARGLHNHPWCWAFALIVWRGYYEHRADGYGAPVVRRRLWPGTVVRLTPSTFHRVELVGDKPSWSLFLAGPVFKDWGFVDDEWKFRPSRELTFEQKFTP